MEGAAHCICKNSSNPHTLLTHTHTHQCCQQGTTFLHYLRGDFCFWSFYKNKNRIEKLLLRSFTMILLQMCIIFLHAHTHTHTSIYTHRWHLLWLLVVQTGAGGGGWARHEALYLSLFVPSRFSWWKSSWVSRIEVDPFKLSEVLRVKES